MKMLRRQSMPLLRSRCQAGRGGLLCLARVQMQQVLQVMAMMLPPWHPAASLPGMLARALSQPARVLTQKMNWWLTGGGVGLDVVPPGMCQLNGAEDAAVQRTPDIVQLDSHTPKMSATAITYSWCLCHHESMTA